MNPQISNIAIMLIMSQVSRLLDLADPKTLMIIRLLYVSTNVIAFCIYQMTRKKILKENNLKIVKYIKSGNSLLKEPEKLQIITVRDYDLDQIQSSINGIYSSIAMMFVMHVVMKYNNPLFMQFIGPVKGALENTLVKINLLGKDDDGKRPFKSEPLFGKIPTGDDMRTDKKSIEQLEVAGNGGIKYE
ncbi:similar to Saccharomyces cerevisiae YBR106W PHO88 Probable membrane protein, involved in phosphate transport [Maudiozyma saulgeensis]|uniref:Similar to Saccharomyces cerevisiae YBR106W PHO88 Probable membrane protein, involved in phosphate transport n=1 Tax=Maudiozyma saulgeensis TaxID=1789683 RepID=A0A1X7QXJ0_9SACH|nr:similar to Saccharomyces cerevisiae YBR106W PHO88 Probable membrane protein, involved in phosphate transport [Kazachstania saulgeensis]